MASTTTIPSLTRIGPIALPREIVDQLDAIASTQKVDRNVLVRALVEAGLCAQHDPSCGDGRAPRARMRTRTEKGAT